jgi:hypothetical protein
MDKFTMVQEIRKGNLNSFTFDGEDCQVYPEGPNTYKIIRHTGQKAIIKGLGSTIDLYGPVCFLRKNEDIKCKIFED